MNLLTEGLQQQAVIKTTLTRKLTIDGIAKPYPVYKIRLDVLFYNDQNDRIATWISQYKAQNGQAPDLSDREAYNDIIEKFIVESNPDALKKTQTNIELVDQREAGVVLADGRIIDGNRRFTCLRRLSAKSDRFQYFEAVILDRNIESSAKQIKMLELSIQHGEETKVDYNPIDRLVGIYHDIVETQLLSEEEYAKSTNETLGDVKNKVALAQLMVEFLEFINAPMQFYIARELQIYYPLEELQKLLKKCHAEEEREALKISVFNNIVMQPSGDISRYIRNFKTVLGTDYQEEFLEEQKEMAMQTTALLPPEGAVTTAVIREQLRGNGELRSGMQYAVEKVMGKVKRNETRNRPIQLAEKATAFLEDIDQNILAKMSDSERQRLEKQLKRLLSVVSELQEKL